MRRLFYLLSVLLLTGLLSPSTSVYAVASAKGGQCCVTCGAITVCGDSVKMYCGACTGGRGSGVA